jgi:hypothetical protein
MEKATEKEMPGDWVKTLVAWALEQMKRLKAGGRTPVAESRRQKAAGNSDNGTSFETNAQSGRRACPRYFCS